MFVPDNERDKRECERETEKAIARMKKGLSQLLQNKTISTTGPTTTAAATTAATTTAAATTTTTTTTATKKVPEKILLCRKTGVPLLKIVH